MSRSRSNQPRSGCLAGLHDTLWAYREHSCRCPAAVEANTERHRRANRRRHPLRGTRPPGRRSIGADVDAGRVAEALAGLHVDLNAAELAAAIDQYDRGGRSAADVARHLGCTTRTVVRHRAARRERAA